MEKIGYLIGKNMLDWEPERICDTLRSAGYNAIEVPGALLCGGDKTAADRKRFFDAARSAELRVSAVGLQRDFVVSDRQASRANALSVAHSMEDLADWEVDTVNVFTGPMPWIPNPVKIGHDMTMLEGWNRIFEAFEVILTSAQRTGLRVAVENVWGMLCDDFYTHQFLWNHFRCEYLGVNLDPSHDQLKGNTDMRFLVESWGKDRIFHVHLKDAVGIPVAGKFLFPLLGEGEVDWKAFFDALRAIGYEGVMSVEFESWAYLARELEGHYEQGAVISRRAVDMLMRL